MFSIISYDEKGQPASFIAYDGCAYCGFKYRPNGAQSCPHYAAHMDSVRKEHDRALATGRFRKMSKNFAFTKEFRQQNDWRKMEH